MIHNLKSRRDSRGYASGYDAMGGGETRPSSG